MRINNIDGKYQTKDGRIKIEVTRQFITFEISEPEQVHIIDGGPVNREAKRDSGPRTADRIKQIVKDTNDILWG